jgi:AraC-like DNA-binding protein
MIRRHDLSLREYGPSRGSHSHAHFQVLVGLGGVLELEVEGLGRRIAAGDGFIVSPGDRHDFEAVHGSSCLVLDTADELWARCAAMPRRPRQVHALASYLAQALTEEQPLASMHGAALLLEAWSPAAQRPARPRRAIDWQALAAWVQARIHLPLTVADLAEHACLSTSQFALRCHEEQGLGPQEWLRGRRLDRARQLRDAGLPVAQVALRTGYRSPSALTAALRRRAH